jgi:hypothetical protein
MLEQQQAQLVAGLRELYTRMQNGQGWPGQPLRETQGRHPLTHDILERLELLHPSSESSNNYEGFEEDCSRMQQKLVERGAPFTHRRGSTSSSSEHGHSSSGSSYGGTPTTKSMPYSDPFPRHNAPPTPPMNSPFTKQSQIPPPIKQEAPIVTSNFMNNGALDPSALTRSAWPAEPMIVDESLDYNSKAMYTYDPFSNYDSNAMMLDPCIMNPTNPMLPQWNDPGEFDISSFIQGNA